MCVCVYMLLEDMCSQSDDFENSFEFEKQIPWPKFIQIKFIFCFFSKPTRVRCVFLLAAFLKRGGRQARQK